MNKNPKTESTKIFISDMHIKEEQEILIRKMTALMIDLHRTTYNNGVMTIHNIQFEPNQFIQRILSEYVENCKISCSDMRDLLMSYSERESEQFDDLALEARDAHEKLLNDIDQFDQEEYSYDDACKHLKEIFDEYDSIRFDFPESCHANEIISESIPYTVRQRIEHLISEQIKNTV